MMRIATIYILFFLSGAAALVYEISWSRQLGLRLGNTADAAATVLAAYFIGMGLGYELAGRCIHRIRRPLLLYGVCEIAAAAWAVFVPTLLTAAAPLAADHGPLVRAMVCLLLLLPATVPLGATLPLVAKVVEALLPKREALAATLAYGVNTLGALVGVLAATGVMLARLGVVGSSVAAAALAAGCGIVAVAVSRSGRPDWTCGSNDSDGAPSPATGPLGPSGPTLAAICGFATIALQVLYTRLFSLVFHNSTYTFGLVVAVMLLALGLAAPLAGWLGKKLSPRTLFTAAAVAAGLLVAVSTVLFLLLTELQYVDTGDTLPQYLAACGGLVMAVVFPAALAAGLLLPSLWQFAGQDASPAAVGRLTAANTWAAALGALAASFLLLPRLWLWGSFTAVAVVYLVAGLLPGTTGLRARRYTSTASEGRRTHVAVVTAAICIGCVIFAIAASHWITTRWDGVPPNRELVARWEGAYGWIDVVRDPGDRDLSMRQNIHYTLGATGSARWERRQTHLPLLLHPRPRDVLLLGMGTGATARGALPHGSVEQVDVVELIPEVVAAAEYFDRGSADLSTDPRVQIHVADARRYLQTSALRYDVIVADLYVPWESKTGYLYTVEHFELARQRLADGGVFCQWLALWQLGEAEFEMIADSFAEVFPHTTVWWCDVRYRRAVIGLIGSEQEVGLDMDELKQRLTTLAAANPVPDRQLANPSRLANHYIGRWKQRPGKALNRDEHPRLEFSMPAQFVAGRTLSHRALQAYNRDTLSKLPQTGVTFHQAQDPITNADDRRWWQQTQLRK